MAVEDEIAEPEQQVLAQGLDSVERPAVELLHARSSPALVRGMDIHLRAGQRSTYPPSDTVDGIALSQLTRLVAQHLLGV
jgi:hypothetical protein